MTLADYLHSYLGSTLTTELGFTVAGGSYSFPVDDAVEAYGVSTEAEATDLGKLHAIGKVKVMEFAIRNTANAVDYTADTSSVKLSQLNSQLRDSLRDAMNDAMVYLPNYVIETGDFTYDLSDPYVRFENTISLERDNDMDEFVNG